MPRSRSRDRYSKRSASPKNRERKHKYKYDIKTESSETVEVKREPSVTASKWDDEEYKNPRLSDPVKIKKEDELDNRGGRRARQRLLEPVIIKDEPDSEIETGRRHDHERSKFSRDDRRNRLKEPAIISNSSSDKYPEHPLNTHQTQAYRNNSRSRSPRNTNNCPPSPQNQWNNGRTDNSNNKRKEKTDTAVEDKKTANFALSGKLTEDTNTYNGVVIKYNEPEDARKPTEHWRLYPFKGKESLPVLHIHRQSGFLIGRDRKIADIPMDHPSISKQHAVLQFRSVKGLIRLYVIDLETVNGTYLNNKRIDPRRFYELKDQDMVKFGYSSREYIVMHAESYAEQE